MRPTTTTMSGGGDYYSIPSNNNNNDNVVPLWRRRPAPSWMGIMGLLLFIAGFVYVGIPSLFNVTKGKGMFAQNPLEFWNNKHHHHAMNEGGGGMRGFHHPPCPKKQQQQHTTSDEEDASSSSLSGNIVPLDHKTFVIVAKEEAPNEEDDLMDTYTIVEYEHDHEVPLILNKAVLVLETERDDDREFVLVNDEEFFENEETLEEEDTSGEATSFNQDETTSFTEGEESFEEGDTSEEATSFAEDDYDMENDPPADMEEEEEDQGDFLVEDMPEEPLEDDFIEDRLQNDDAVAEDWIVGDKSDDMFSSENEEEETEIIEAEEGEAELFEGGLPVVVERLEEGGN